MNSGWFYCGVCGALVGLGIECRPNGHKQPVHAVKHEHGESPVETPTAPFMGLGYSTVQVTTTTTPPPSVTVHLGS
jgi:hypothetical protein